VTTSITTGRRTRFSPHSACHKSIPKVLRPSWNVLKRARCGSAFYRWLEDSAARAPGSPPSNSE